VGWRILVGVLAVSGCRGILGIEDPTLATEPDAPLPPDAPTCFGTGLVTVCFAAPPSGRLDVEAETATVINTNTACDPYIGDPGWCVVARSVVAVSGTLRAFGSRPLVLVASDSVTVIGAIDVSSVAGDPSTCDPGIGAAAPSGGGAGGTFGGTGGNGGASGTGAPGGVAAAIGGVPSLRGGCPGGAGASAGGVGGLGGGAVYVIAGASITIPGTINASGGGGFGGTGDFIRPGGAGGGGAGGMIGLDAPVVEIVGSVLANGGGGGEGGGNPNPGARGESPTKPDGPAAGGAGGAIYGGDGGPGGAGTSAAGAGIAGNNNIGGGGGGGGGVGIIRVFPTRTFGTNVSPPPS
jgi:hypothetical protein